MQEQIEQLWEYVQGAWRFRWYAAAALWVIALAGWGASFSMPNEYRASAQVHVDTESMLEPLMRGMVVDAGTQRRVELMTRTLLSRPNLERVARRTDLDLAARTPAELDSLIDRLEKRTQLSGTGRDNMYQITYTGPDPEQAHDVVQALLSLLVEESMGRSRQDTDSATAFLDRKVQEYEARLEAAEEALMNFKRANVGLLPGSGGDYYDRLQERMADMDEARFRLRAARSRVAELERELVGESPVFGIMGATDLQSVETPELDARIEALRARQDELLLKYTAEHPQVVALREKLDRLEQDREQRVAELSEQMAAPGRVPQSSGLEQNPVHQQIRGALAAARSDVAAAESELAHYRGQVEELREKVDTIPQVEARLKQLQRDQDVARATYHELLERQQSAVMSEDVRSTQKTVEFRVVEPPRVPGEPVAPNRPFLVTASFGAALVGSAGLGVLLSLLRPAVYTRSGLYAVAHLPVLGTVGRVYTARERRRRRAGLAAFALVIAGAAMAYGIAMAIAAGIAPAPI